VISFPGVSLLLVLLLCGLSLAEVVSRIEVRGNRFVPDNLIRELLLTKEGGEFSLQRVRKDINNLIRELLLTKEGGEFSLQRVRKDIRRLFRTGFFEDLPVIYRIEFEGNEELSDSDLADKLGVETEVGKIDVDELITGYTSSPALEERLEIQRKLKLGRVLSQKEIDALMRRIREIYREEGYPDVRVTYRIVPKKGASKLVFHIDEGEEKYVVDIVFKGNRTFSSGGRASLR